MNSRILLVDDEEPIRSLLTTVLTKDNHEVTEAADAAGLRQAFARPQPDVMLLDLHLPDAEGLDLLPVVKSQWPRTEVIILTGYGSIATAVAATKLGAYDFQTKPFEYRSLLMMVKRAIDHKQLADEASGVGPSTPTSNGIAAIFESSAMRETVRTIERIAPSEASVFITGESGTGKEVAADLIHARSLRSRGPFVKINCAALPRELIESELFGSVRGAFTGANVDREGLFRQAEGGTLLLDELAEMPVDTQSKLLRVLQEREVRPVGGKTTYKTNCRIVASTNLSVDDAIKSGKLRRDLYYRVSTISVHLAPLRERIDDIIPLARSFLKRFAAQARRTLSDFAPEAGERLRRFEWPGNVRQLQNEIQRVVLMADGPIVNVLDLSLADPFQETNGSELSLLQRVERDTIIRTLKETGGNKQETALRLGIGRQTLYNKMRSYGIPIGTIN